MTNYQLVALLFPIATAVGAGLTGLLAKKIWVDRPAAEPLPAGRSSELFRETMANQLGVSIDQVEIIRELTEADDLIQQAKRRLQRTAQ